VDSKPAPPPAAVLIRLARKAAGLTVAEAARRASAASRRGISTARWSQVENGYEVRGGGLARPVEAEAGMLAHMAHTAGVSPERLESEGRRPDAAEILREIGRRHATDAAAASDAIEVRREEAAGPDTAAPVIPPLAVREPAEGFPPPPEPEVWRQWRDTIGDVWDEVLGAQAREGIHADRIPGSVIFGMGDRGAYLWDVYRSGAFGTAYRVELIALSRAIASLAAEQGAS